MGQYTLPNRSPVLGSCKQSHVLNMHISYGRLMTCWWNDHLYPNQSVRQTLHIQWCKFSGNCLNSGNQGLVTTFSGNWLFVTKSPPVQFHSEKWTKYLQIHELETWSTISLQFIAIFHVCMLLKGHESQISPYAFFWKVCESKIWCHPLVQAIWPPATCITDYCRVWVAVVANIFSVISDRCI